MLRRSFLCQIALPGLAFSAPEGSRRMRVIYAGPEVMPALATQPREELGRLDDGVWVACPDETVRALAVSRAPLFLYFDRQAYDAAVAGLSSAAVREVIRRRLKRWAPQSQGYVMSWLFDLERVRLEAALQVAPNVVPNIVPDAVEPSLQLLQRLAGLDRYRMEPAKAMAVEILEGEARLLACLQSALHAGIASGEQPQLSKHLEQRNGWAKTMSQIAGMLGANQFANGLPAADPERGVFVHPADQGMEKSLTSAGEPAVQWRDGLVCAMPERQLARWRGQGHSADLLYAEAGDFYDSVEMLTPDQLHRDFAVRLGRSTVALTRDLLSQIDRLHLHQILMKRQLRGRNDAAKVCTSAGLDGSLRGEVAALGASLASDHSFSRLRGLDSAGPPLALFRTVQELSRADAALFAGIAARYWPAIAPNLQEVQALITAR